MHGAGGMGSRETPKTQNKTIKTHLQNSIKENHLCDTGWQVLREKSCR